VLADSEAVVPGSGSAETGNWIKPGTVFKLVDSATGQILAVLNVDAQF
jgi:hypothetical protein